MHIVIVMIFIISFFGSNFYTTNAQWEMQISGVNANLIDVSFVDSLNGCVIGDSSTILTTHDGGENWTKQVSPIDTIRFTKVQFITQNTGFIIGENGLFLATTDGGNVWINKETGYYYNFSDLSFVDSLNGWLSCWLETQSERIGVILHTVDGGDTWTKQVEKISNQLFNSTIFMAIEFLNDSVGWAFGGDYADNFSATFLYYTHNAGNNWNIIGQHESSPLFELNIASGDTLWGSKWQHTISFDGGSNWIFYPENNNASMGAASPVTGLSGWIFSSDFNTQERKILFTSDGGKSWLEELDLGPYSFVSAMTNVNGEFLWIVGDNGLIKYKENNPTSINNPKVQNENFSLKQNYPNPFNPSTTIRYTIPQFSDVILTIYDIMGREIISFRLNSQSAGTHELEWNGTNNKGAIVSSGIYIYRFRASDLSGSGEVFEKTQKLMLMK
jgi:photosystem II stability/assembly factor-like uncharacterized protein